MTECGLEKNDFHFWNQSHRLPLIAYITKKFGRDPIGGGGDPKKFERV
jgi:hypothetical protein